jgi:DNA-binding NarL/FixJ family response regulator
MDEKVTVFLVDDHVMVREGLAALAARDPSIEVVGQCGEGLEVVKRVRELRPDVVVLDITIPGLNGLDVCRQLARKAKKTAVLILTMHEDEQFIARALANGASGYLLKEAAAAEFVAAVRRVARGEVYLGPGIPKSVLDRVRRDAADPYEQLTPRERQVLHMIAEGKTNRAIAGRLEVSVKTVDTHRTRLMQKLGIHDQTSLIKYCLRRGIVTLT